VPEFAWQRHGAEVPQPFAGADVERARVAGLGEIHFAGRCAKDRHVFIDRRHAIPGHGNLDDARVAKVTRRLSGRGIERDELRSGSQDDARRETAIARPVRHAPRRRPCAGRQRVPPHFFAGVGFEREHLIAAGREIHYAANHNRGDLRITARRLGAFSRYRSSGRAASLCGRCTSGARAATRRRTLAAASSRASAATTCGRLREAYGPRLRQRAHVVGVDVGQR
jgi:hypothetical protein